MKKIFAICAFAFLALSACSEQEPSIVAGREWNAGSQVVADTTSQFNLDDVMVVQLNYGKKFDFSQLKTTFFQGTSAAKGKEIWSHEVSVSNKLSTYTLQGKSKRGFLMNARELTRLKEAGSVVVEFSANGKVIASKDLTLVASGK